MNVHNPVNLTAAEEVLGFELPTRRVESWHYTDLKALLREVPQIVGEPDTKGDNYKRLVPAFRLPFYDGRLFEDMADALPEGVSVRKRAEKPSANRIDDAVIAMNGVEAGDAVDIVIGGDSTAEKPLGLAHVSNSEGFSTVFHRVTIQKGANASVIDRHMAMDAVSYLSNAVTELKVEKDATCKWYILQQESKTATRLARLNVTLAENSDLTIFVLNAGGKLVRQEINVVVNGEGANLDIKGVNLVGDNAHIDVTTVLEHKVPHTTANELFRNVVAGDGLGVFQGQIKVAQPAQKTDAQMACNTLLLTDSSDFSAKPELEIFADDVVCAHGATVADIDEDHLFYLRARGLPEKLARSLLIKAFVDEVVEELEAEELPEALIDIIDTWLDENVD